jgi:hypothetical protein
VTGYITSCFQAARAAWVDLSAAIRAHWRLACFGFAVCTASSLADVAFNPDETFSGFVTLALTLAIAEALLLAPLLIALHRFIIRGPNAADEPAALLSNRTWRFFALSAVLIILQWVPMLIGQRWIASDEAEIVSLLLLIVAMVVMNLWLALIFPAIAVDAPGAGIGNALADIKGNVWRIFWVGMFACIPIIPIIASFVAIELGRETLTEATGLASQDLRLASAALVGLLDFAFYVLLAVIASHFYLTVGNRLKQSA